jgi:hypothetical protein
MQYIESVTDVLFPDVSLISDTMPISHFWLAPML